MRASSPHTVRSRIDTHPRLLHGYGLRMAADCQVDHRGSECGVLAIGRCASCGKAFCMTHQARDTMKTYVNQCDPCRAKKARYRQIMS